MTQEDKQQLKNFDARVRQLIASYRVLQQENADLYAELDSRDNEIIQLKASLKQAKRDYDNLKLAKMLAVSDNEMRSARQTITSLVREVNKCINILSSGNSAD